MRGDDVGVIDAVAERDVLNEAEGVTDDVGVLEYDTICVPEGEAVCDGVTDGEDVCVGVLVADEVGVCVAVAEG